MILIFLPEVLYRLFPEVQVLGTIVSKLLQRQEKKHKGGKGPIWRPRRLKVRGG